MRRLRSFRFGIPYFGAMLLPLLTIVVIVTPLCIVAAEEDDEDDLGLPGLEATYWTDPNAKGPVAHGLSRRLALMLAPSASLDPAIPAEHFRAEYVGRLFVQRPGKYLFRAELSGRFSLKLGEQVVFTGTVGEGEASSITSGEVPLKYGQIPLVAVLEKTDPAAPTHLRLFWQREGEAEFPVPSAVFSRAKPATQSTTAAETSLDGEAGRTLVADFRCAACHDVGSLSTFAADEPSERAPNLAGIGDRIQENWLHRWLDGPRTVRKQAVMPDLFGDTPADRADLYAATKYLASLVGKKNQESENSAANKPPRQDVVRRGMASIGCIACHLLPDEDPTTFPELRSLNNLGDKLSIAAIRERIADPRAHYPGSRMPNFQLATEQPQLLSEIAAYLATQRSSAKSPALEPPVGGLLEERWNALFRKPAERERFEMLPEQERWTTLGARVVETRGCLNCHDFDKRKTRLPMSTVLVGLPEARRSGGCLSAKPLAPAADFQITDNQRQAIRAALATSTARPARSPLYTAERQLQRNGCLKCHGNGREESFFARRILQFVPLGTDQTIHDLAPPNLAGIGEKLTVRAMQSVIDGKTRARPWMALRMPHFAPEHVAGLGAALASLDGIDPTAPPQAGGLDESAVSQEDIEIGRQLVGRTGLNCVSCHDIRGIAGIGVRGPDLAKVPERIRGEWFRAWLLDPQRLAPGTRMPTVFFGGKSAAPQFLEGDPDRQIEAFWAYLSQGSKMQLPSLAPPANAIVPGGENPRFTPTDRPIIVRGFMPGTAGLRGIALGTPEKMHFAFDSERCALAAAWEGDFAEVGGWYDNGRGTPEDNALKPLGKIVWHGPEGVVWKRYTERSAASSDVLPLRFGAAWAGAKDAGFSYTIEIEPGKRLHVEERPQRTNDGFERRFTLRAEENVPSLQFGIGNTAVWNYVVDGAALSNDDNSPALEQGAYVVVPAVAGGQTHSVVLRYLRKTVEEKKP